MRRLRSVVAGGISAALLGGMLVLGAAMPASAEPVLGPDPDGPRILGDATFTGTQFSGSISGVRTNTVPSPSVPYPAGATGGALQGTAILQLTDSDGNVGQAYCINLAVTTFVGVDYNVGAWSEANVPNLPYISYILNNYFPNVAAVPALANDTERVAAVQAAIWYFSDGFLVSGTSPLYDAVRDIVNLARVNGGVQPALPSLSVSPDTADAPSDGQFTGPFTVRTNASNAVIDPLPSNLRLAYDRAGTQPAAAGQTVLDGRELWASRTGTGTSPFTVSADVSVPGGTVYLADAGATRYQKLVLARTITSSVVAGARVAVYESVEVSIEKIIEGAAAGKQGEIYIQVDCVPAPAPGIQTFLRLPAGERAGVNGTVITGLRAGSTCTATETRDGKTAAVVVRTTVERGTVTAPRTNSDPVPTLRIVNRYDAPLANTGSPADLGGAALAGLALLTGIGIVVLRRRAAAE